MTKVGKSQQELIADLDTHASDPLLNISTVARALDKHPATVGRWIETGLIRAIRVGKLHKIRKSVLEKLLMGSALGEDERIVNNVKSLKE